MPGILQNDFRNGHQPGGMPGAGSAPGDKTGAPGAESLQQQPLPPVEEFIVVNQEIFLEVNFREKSVQGESRITIYLTNPDDPPDEVALDARQCEINTDDVRVNGKPVAATYIDPYEFLDLPPSWDLTASNFPVFKNRLKKLLPRRRRDLPVEKREQAGCDPADRSLRVSLRPRPAKPPQPAPSQSQPQPGKLKVRVSAIGSQDGASTSSSSNTITGGGSGQPVQAPAVSQAGPAQGGQADSSDQPPDGLFEIVIPFRTTHIRDGLHFVGVEASDTRFPHVYTRHSPEPGIAACIFPCIDDPGSRCFWKIHIKCPRTLGDALMQQLASNKSSSDRAANTNGSSTEAIVARSSHPQQPLQGATATQRELQLTEEDKLLDMTVVCAGNLVGEKVDDTDETKKIMTFEITDHGSAAHHIGFAIGPFEHVDLFSDFRTEEADEKLGASALKIHGYCLPGRQDQVRNTCVALARAADEFAMTYGRYPYDAYKLCFVDDMIEDTTPVLSLSLCSSRMLFPDDILERDIEVTRKLVHSLAYQYFGAYIVPNQRTELWLTVGIAYYMTDLFLQKLCGNNDYRFRIKSMADQLAEEDRGRPSLHDLGAYAFLGDFEMKFMALKAPLVLFILDKRLAKAAGSASASLARVISKIIGKANTSGWGDNNNEIISSDTFRRVCEKTSQYQLETFWNQWVLGSGCPWLSIKQRFNRKRLCVEISVTQTQDGAASKARPIRHADFWRELVEKKYGGYSRKVQRLFTGPMTIRIHEANGTPYEHIVEIREDAAFTGAAKFDIPYNTKYKRLKRNRRNREKLAAAAAADPNGENGEDMIVYSLGDKLENAADMAKWELIDWTEQDEKSMDQESYEWIRIDSDFEWICKIHTNMPSWMYLSQLQQDRDIVAQQDTLLYLSRIREHAMSATILTRTLYDERYFHGLRTMAADILSRQAWKMSDNQSEGADGAQENGNGNGAGSDSVVYRGMTQLVHTFREFYCYPDSTPRPNDFSDRRQYLVQCAIIDAVAKVQLEDKHPREAQKFLLDLLRFNNNAENTYSDHLYVARLLVALANSFCSKSPNTSNKRQGGGKNNGMDMSLTFDDGMSDDDDEFGLGAAIDRMEVETEDKLLLDNALAEIERYRRMDEWTGSYQNAWTTAALESKRRLMKAGVIPIDALEFVRYLQDGTVDVVQIKAFEALIDLGLMLRPVILRLLLATMSLHSSPYMRDRLFKLFCQGLASVAFGEHDGGSETADGARVKKEGEDGLANGSKSAKTGDEMEDDDDDDNGGLIIEQGDAVIKKHQQEHARRENLDVALKALKEAAGSNRELQQALWEAMLSPATGSTEKRNLMELMETIFEGDLSLLLTVKHPTMPTVTRRLGTAILDFKKVQRPLKPKPLPPPPTPAAPQQPLASATPAPSVPTLPGVAATAPSATPAVPVPATNGTAAAAAAAAAGPALTPSGRTLLPGEPKKHATPKIKLQTGRSSLGGSVKSATPGSTGSASTPILIRKPAVVNVHQPTTPAASQESMGDSIAVQPVRRQSTAGPSEAAPAPAAASQNSVKDSHSVAAKPVATGSPAPKRKRADHDDHGPGGASSRPRKLIKIAVPAGHQHRLSPMASQWLSKPHVPAARPSGVDSIRASGHGHGGGFATPKSGSPGGSQSRRASTATPGSSQQHRAGLAPTPPDSHPNKDGTGAGGVDRHSPIATKPARKPLPSGPSSAAPAPATPAPAVVAPPPPPPPAAATPTPSKPIFIKFKTKK